VCVIPIVARPRLSEYIPTEEMLELSTVYAICVVQKESREFVSQNIHTELNS
jgi:hypothetical protein